MRDPGGRTGETQGVLDCPVKPGNDNAEGHRPADAKSGHDGKEGQIPGDAGKPGVHELRISVSGLPGQAG